MCYFQTACTDVAVVNLALHYCFANQCKTNVITQKLYWCSIISFNLNKIFNYENVLFIFNLIVTCYLLSET